MVDALVFNYNGTIKEIKINENTINNNKISILNLCKLCNFRKETNFDNIYTESILYNKKIYKIEIWGRNVGKTNVLNKNNLPLNNNVFGNCVMICFNNNTLINLTLEFWNLLKTHIDNNKDEMYNEDNKNTEKNNEYYVVNNEYNDELIFSNILQKEEYYLSDEE
tara:strand:- start:1163 stop:1657 length:495 start_codon:yes stop_codon:yes gene_type:complete